METDACSLLMLCVRQIADEDVPRAQGAQTPCGDLSGREVQKGGDMCVWTADSFCSTVGTNTTL